MFTLIAAELVRELANDRVRNARRHRSDVERDHRVQRERVRASLLLRPEPQATERRGG